MTQTQTRGIRTIKSLLIEDAVMTILAYGTLGLFAFGWLSFVGLQLALLIYVIRVFNLRHERAHLPLKTESRLLFFISNALEVYHLPLQEPFSEKRKKHVLHHQAHTGHRVLTADENPHERLESGLLSAILTAAFYHEVMFFLDFRRERGFSRVRFQTLSLACAAIGLTVWLTGWSVFLLFVLAYRVASFVAWFSFSYVLHIERLYVNELGPKLPRLFKRATEWLLGSGTVTAIFYHQFHHRHPTQFFKF